MIGRLWANGEGSEEEGEGKREEGVGWGGRGMFALFRGLVGDLPYLFRFLFVTVFISSVTVFIF